MASSAAAMARRVRWFTGADRSIELRGHRELTQGPYVGSRRRIVAIERAVTEDRLNEGGG
jgi:hypothetical protein